MPPIQPSWQSAPPKRRLENRRPRILVAEDDDEVRWALTRLLELVGYQVAAVRDGAALLENLAQSVLLEQAQEPPDAIVTDIRLPGFNGLNLVEGLRQNGCTIPVAVISAFGDPQIRQRVQQLEAATYFDKPFDPWALEAVLWRALSAEPT